MKQQTHPPHPPPTMATATFPNNNLPKAPARSLNERLASAFGSPTMSTLRPSRPLRRSFSLWGLIVSAWVAAFSLAAAQEVSVLQTVTSSSSVVQDAAGNFYGTTIVAGSANQGTLFKVAPDGTITTLHTFGAQLQSYNGNLVNDGSRPSGNLILANDGNLYGTTATGGNSDGTVYKISTTGTGYTILHCFMGDSLGGFPQAGVIQGADGNFYGTTAWGGDSGVGVIFRLKPDGTFTVIHDFDTTGDAASPALALVQDAQGNLYGATAQGGSAGMGAIYKIDTLNIYSVIYNFPAATSTFSYLLGSSYTAGVSGGLSPNSALAVDAHGNLYGTASSPVLASGALYFVTPQGVLTVLHRFGGAGDGAEGPTLPPNTTGTPNPATPDRLIVAPNGTVYGVTQFGGAAHEGTVFSFLPTGQFTLLHSFGDGSVANEGANPFGLIMGSDGNFYGTTGIGGGSNEGTLFKITTALPGFTSPLSVVTTPGVPFSYQIAASEGPVTFSVSGLPAGFTFDGTNTISATPTVTGTFTMTLTATNAAGSNTVPLVVTVESAPVISSLLNVIGTTSSLAYSIQATQNPTSFTATGLPPGISVNPVTGLFIGTPTTAGTYAVALSATNAVGTGTANLTVQILSAAPTANQQYGVLHNVGDGSVPGEGTFPGAMTRGNDGTFFGVTAQGGTGGSGTVFNLMASGVMRVVANFNGSNGSAPQGVIQTADGTLYGTTVSGGSANFGTIFKITPDGTITVLHSFGDNSVANDGTNPQAGLVLASDGNFYGTTQNGGSASSGVVFKMTPAGQVTTLHSFGDSTVTNDGAQPVAALIQGSGSDVSPATTGVVLIGTTLLGGAQNDGTLFAITDSGAVSILHSFGDPTVTNDGWLPHAPVTIGGGILGRRFFGTTMTGGAHGKGTVFAYSSPITLNSSTGQTVVGGGMLILHSFGDGTVANDGENPISPLVIDSPAFLSIGNTFYGTTQGGGLAGQGTLFSCSLQSVNGSVATATTTILHSFGDTTFANDGTMALGGVAVGTDGNLYGTTVGGGSGSGTMYDFQLRLTGTSLGVTPLPTGWVLSGTMPLGMTFDSNTGALIGTPSNAAHLGTYSVTVSYYSENSTVQSTQTITLNLNQAFTTWENLHAVGSVGTNGTSANAKDGVPTALKYLFDISNPGQTMSVADHAALPSMSVDNTSVPGTPYLALTYRQFAGATGMDVSLESSDDMVTWTPVTGTQLLKKQAGTDQTTQDPMMEMGTPVDGSVHQFIRLKVTPQ